MEARRGDLVVVPGAGYASRVLIGEFITDAGELIPVRVPTYADDTIPARRVQWIVTEIPKWRFPDELIRIMQNQHALITAPQSLRNLIYDVAFDQYITPNQTASDFGVTREDVDFYDWIKAEELLAYFTSLYSALDSGAEGFFDLTVHEALEQFYKRKLVEFAVEIHSPGQVTLRSDNLLLPLFITTMLALAGTQASEALGQEVSVEHREAGQREDVDACILDVANLASQALSRYKALRWQEICERRHRARDDVGLHGQADARPSARKGSLSE